MKSRFILRALNRPALHGLRGILSRQPALGSLCRCAQFSSSPRFLAPRLGQPTHETHPHLLKAGEVTPGCTAMEYALRRARLASHLPRGAIAVIPSATLKFRSGPVFYEFHQDPDFFYLTGFLEPESVAVIEKVGSDGEHVFHLFAREKDEHAELWDGARTGVEAATEFFNADKAYDIDRLHYHLAPLVENATTIYVDASNQITSAHNALSALLAGKVKQPLRQTMHQLRVRKSDAEAMVMRHAGKASGRAFNRAIAQHFSYEKDLYAFLEYEFKRRGCDGSAYVPVVAGGKNALSIHYVSNDDVLRDGDLVLVDAGGKYGGYMTDITRTWPVNGIFSPAQRDLYTAVLNVQRKCVALCRETLGHSLDDIHRIAERGLQEELAQLGFDLSNTALRDIIFPHHVGHYVGVDLHDCGTYGRVRKLQSGQVVTIEPAVYVPDDARWPKHFRGMGIRIEDSVYVGKENPIVLSAEAVKEIEDIEALRETEHEQSSGLL